MAAADFKLTAELILVGPKGLAQVAKKLAGIQIPASAAKSATGFANAIGNLQSKVNSLSKSTQKLGQNLSKTKTGFKSVGKSAQQTRGSVVQAGTAMENFGRTVGFVTTRLVGFRIASGLVLGFGGAIRSAVSDAIAFERELVRVAQVLDKDITQLSHLSKEITRLSVGFGVASSDLVKVSKTLSQAGLSAKDTRIALEALAKSTLLPTFGDINQTVEGSIAIFNQFQLEAKDLEGVLASIDAVTGKLAVEASDVIVAVKKAGGVFSALNRDVDNGVQSFQEFLAIFASVRQTTRESAQNIAVGLRTIFARIQRPRTIQFLKEFGIELEGTGDQAGQLLKPLAVLDKLSAVLGEVGARNLNIGQIVQQLGGTRQVAKVLPLLFQQELRQRALSIAAKGQANAEEKLNKALDTLAVRIAQVREEFKAFIRDIVHDDVFKTMAESVLNLVQAVIKLAGAIKPILPILAIFAGIKSVSLGRQFAGGFFGGIRQNPLAAGGGAVGASAISSQQTSATIQRSSIQSNTVALTALTRQLQRMVLGGGGVSGRTRMAAVGANRGSNVFVGGGRVGGGRASGRQFGFGRTSGIRTAGIGGRVGRFAQRHTGGLALAGAVGGFAAAGAIGTKTRNASAGGGALTGGSIGALIGSQINPIFGTIIGGLGGALFGATEAAANFDKQLKRIKLTDLEEGLEKVFQQFEQGEITFEQLSEKQAQNFRDLRLNLPSIDKFAVQGGGAGFGPPGAIPPTSITRIPNSIEELIKFGEELRSSLDEKALVGVVQAGFRSGKSFEELSKDTELVRALGAQFGNLEVAAVRVFNQIETENEALERAGLKFLKSQESIAGVAAEAAKLNFVLNFAQDNFRKFGARLRSINQNVGQASLTAAQTALSRAQGRSTMGGITTRNVFENIQGVSPSVVSSELSRFGLGGDIAANVNLARILPSILRSVAGRATNINPLKSSTQDIFKEELGKRLPTGSQIFDIFAKKIDDVSDKSTQGIFDALIKEIPKIFGPSLEATQEFVRGMNKAFSDLRKDQNQFIQLRLQNLTTDAAIAANAVNIQNSSISASGGTLSLQQQLGPLFAQLKSLGVGTSVQQILQSRQGAVGEKLDRTTIALELLSKATDALTIVQKEIASFEQSRVSSKQFIQDTFLKSPEQRKEIVKQQLAFRNALRGGQFTPDALRGGKLAQAELVRRRQPKRAEALDVFLTRQIAKRFPGARSVGGGIGLKAPGQAAPRLLQQQNVFGQQIIDAQRARAKIRQDETDRFARQSNITFQLRVRALRIEAAFREKQARIDNSVLQQRFDVLNQATTNLTRALQTSSTVTLVVPQPIPLVVQGGGALANEIADEVSKRIAESLSNNVNNVMDPTLINNEATSVNYNPNGYRGGGLF